MPVLELEDGTMMPESTCILRYLARLHGFYPTDPLELARAEEALNAMEDIAAKFTAPFFAKEASAKEAATNELFDNVLPAYLKIVEKDLATRKFIAGDNLTFADFYCGGLYTNFVNNDIVGFAADKWKTALDNAPNFKAYGERFSAEMKTYLDTRAKAPV